MKKEIKLFVVLILLGVATTAEANAGTPLMWASILHLIFGNLLIGLLEGLLLAKVFSLSKKKCVGLLILANYISAWSGGIILRFVCGALTFDLNNAWTLFWLLVPFTYVVTLVIEFPFIAVAFRGVPSWLRKSIQGSFLVQTISYLLIFGWYWLASGTTLYTTTDVVGLSEMSLPDNTLMYFVSDDDGDIYAGPLTNAKQRYVFDLNSSDKNARLFARPSAETDDAWDVVVRLGSEGPAEPHLVEIESGVMPAAVCEDERCRGTWMNFGEVPKLGEAQSSSWDFSAGFWAVEGLRGTEKFSGESVWISFETPFVAWYVRNVTHLPGDKVLFQLGENQICVYDPIKKQIALVAKGRGPLVIEEKAVPSDSLHNDGK